MADMVNMDDVIGIVLAGGKGERLAPLTKHRSKPAVPFGGNYRIIDFVLSCFCNSKIQIIKILVQTKSQSLMHHIPRVYPSSPYDGRFIDLVPAQQKLGESWYEGTADAVFQNLDMLDVKRHQVAAIFSGDHIFAIDVREMYKFHLEKNASFTICAIPYPVEKAAGQFGVIEVDENGLIIGFEEKPEKPREIPGRPGMCLASMGNYIADVPMLSQYLHEDAGKKDSKHDFGKNIIPAMIKAGEAIYAYDFATNSRSGKKLAYWRDVGTIKAYWEANMDLRNIEPDLDLYNVLERWPIRTMHYHCPPRKEGLSLIGDNNLISDGCITNGSKIFGSVLSPFVRAEKGAEIHDSVIFFGCQIGEGAKIRNAILDKGVVVSPGARIGFSVEEDLSRGFHVEDGITVVPQGSVV